MGRRRAQAATTGHGRLRAATTGVLLPGVGFVLEVAMVASFLYWGLRQPGPWNLVAGLGIPAAVVLLWGIFMAPKSTRRLPDGVVARVSLGMFLLAGAALLSTGALAPGWTMLAVTAVWFAASRAWPGRS